MTIDTQWFVDRLNDRQLSQRGMAKLMGVDPAAVSLMLRGRRRMTIEEAAQIAVLLDVSASEVLEHAGVNFNTGVPKVKVIGYMQGDASVVLFADGSHDMIDAPPGLPNSSVAIQARTAGTERGTRDGWLYFMPEDMANPKEAIGMAAMVAVKGSGLQMAHITKGYRKGTYNLLDHKGSITPNVEIAWARPVLWIKTQP